MGYLMVLYHLVLLFVIYSKIPTMYNYSYPIK